MNASNPNIWVKRGAKQLAWSLGFGSLFIFAQSYALSLQNLQVNSALGEPLDAVIQVTAAPGEVLNATCINTSAVTGGAMPGIPGVRLSLSRQLSPGTIRLTTSRPVREPMSELVVNVRCEGAPSIERRFLIMLDPRGVSENRAAQNASQQNGTNYLQNTVAQPTYVADDTSSAYAAAAAPVIRSDSSSIQVRAATREARYSSGSIARGDRYLVRNGESLSTIASRIEGRARGTVWSWAATLQKANPQAFINGNPNELIAGSSLIIPMTLASGTRALTAARDISATAPFVNSSNRSSTSDTNNSTQSVTQLPLEVNVASSSQTAAVGGVFATQPTMVLARSFSGVSRARLNQRKGGVVHQAPANLPTFGDSANAVANNEPQPQSPAIAPSQIPAAPAQELPKAAVADTASPRRLSWLTALGSLAALGLAFLAGLLIANWRARRELEEQVDARLSEERYYERVRNSRRNVTESVLSAGTTSGIEVSETIHTEEEPADSELEKVAARAANGSQFDTSDLEADPNAAEAMLSNEVEIPDDSDLDLNVGGMDSLTELDLELLERDYAAQTYDDLEKIASAGAGNATELVRTGLDLEFPEDVKMRREADQGFDTMEFESDDSDGLDFDIGSDISRTDETLEGLSIDIAEAGANIDAQIEAIQDAENSVDDSDRGQRSAKAASSNEKDTTSELPSLDNTQDNTNELPTLEDTQDNPDFTATSTRDSEEFYHLEASSIMHVGEMDFEKDLDDETNILRFRKRGKKTGTDGAGET